jgi:uncharacterized protein (TIGR03086 family)
LANEVVDMAAATSDTFQLIDQQMTTFGAKVHAVPADRWSHSTPCTDWSVRDLVNHVVGEHLWVAHLMNGETIAQVGDRYDGDVLGESPADAWEAAAIESSKAWQNTSPDQIVQLSFGDTPALEYGEQMLLDLVIHGWDLARGAGLSEAFEPAAAAHVLGYLELNAEQWRAAGAFGAAAEVGSDDPAAKMLGLTGRQP